MGSSILNLFKLATFDNFIQLTKNQPVFYRIKNTIHKIFIVYKIFFIVPLFTGSTNLFYS